MKREIMKVAVCGALTVCMTVTTGFASLPGTQSETQGLIALLESNTALNTTLDDITETLPEAVEDAVETQEWYKKALANTETEVSIYESTDENSKVVGKMYKNTIVDLEEKGDEWSKISSGDVNGYAKNESLAFGLDAVERSKEVCPAKVQTADGTWITLEDEVNVQSYAKENQVTVIRETQDAKTIERIQAEEEARRKAAEEAARKKAAEEAARKKAAEEAARKKAAEKAAARRKAGTSPKMSASVDDRTLLAAIIYCEAGGEPYEGKVAVGAVILNRVRSGRFPNSIRGVIYQKGQFGPVSSGKLARVLASGKTTGACYQAADAALAGSNPIGSRLFFGNGNTGLRIGNHYFH